MTTRRVSWAASTASRLVVSVALGAAVALGVLAVGPGRVLLGALVGWIATASVFTGWTWLRIRAMDAAGVREHARREDPSRAVGDLLLLLACAGAVVGVGALLLAGAAKGDDRALNALVGVGAVVAAWFVTHLLFTLRYAREHVADPDRGIDIEGDEPTYADFAYVGYTIGMTYQVSDTGFKSTELRRTALQHALVSYFMGAVVIACTINLVVQLATPAG